MDGHLRKLVFLCEREGLECGRLYPGGSLGIGGTFQTCLSIDLLLEGAMDQATSQGLSNGLTLVLLTGDMCHEKTDLKVFVVVIPKEGWVRVAAPILLLV